MMVVLGCYFRFLIARAGFFFFFFCEIKKTRGALQHSQGFLLAF